MAVGNESKQSATRYYSSPKTFEFDAISEEYAQYWGQRSPDVEHYLNVRRSLVRWYQRLRDEKNIKPSDGVAVVCGPGFGVADSQDFDPVIVDTILADHPRTVIADFSKSVLTDAEASLLKASSNLIRARLRERILYARRDFSGGLSARLDAYIKRKFDTMQSGNDWLEFLHELAKVVDVPDIQNEPVLPGRSDHGDPAVLMVDPDEMLCMRNITNNIAPIRFVIANLLLDGMFAVTEDEFRRRLMEFHAASPDIITSNEVSRSLQLWHLLILNLNHHVATGFIQRALDDNPDAHIFATVDSDVCYYGINAFDRLDCNRLRGKLSAYRIRLSFPNAWELGDPEEVPPHVHHVTVIEAFRGAGSDAELPTANLHVPGAQEGESSEST